MPVNLHAKLKAIRKLILSSAKILIHSHPQLAYILRCALLAELDIYPGRELEYSILHGSNLIPGLESHFAGYLQSSKILSSFGIKCSQILFSSFANITREEQIINDYEGIASSMLEHNSSSLPDNLWLAITDSIWDTIYRGLDPKIDLIQFYQSDNAFKLNTYKYKKEEFFWMLNIYLKIFSSVKPDHVFLSHGNYNPYLALISACYIYDIPFTIIHGGHQWILSPLPGSYPNTFSPFAAVRDITLSNLPEPFLNRSTSQRTVSLRDKNNSFINYINSLQDLVSVNQVYEKKYIMITMPILMEVNNHYSSESEIYTSRYEWLKDTLFCALDATLNVIIKRHPHESDEESKLIDALLKRFSTEHVNFISHVQVAHSIEDLKMIIPSNVSRHEIAFYIYQSMSSCELPQIGIIPYSANKCFAHPSFYHSFSTKSDYLASIKGLKTKQANPTISPDKQDLALSYVKLCSTLGYGNPHGGFRKALDQYYHFGNIRNNSVTSIEALRKSILNNLTYKYFYGNDFRLAKEEYCDLNQSRMFTNNLEL